jgi:DNA-binding transcriptional LysR family regulator
MDSAFSIPWATDFTQLKTFRLVAATGSFTQAAAALHYAQSSVTAHIQALEGDLGVHLFQRLSRRVVLTPAGARLLRSADTLLRQVEQARQAVRAPEVAVFGFHALRLMKTHTWCGISFVSSWKRSADARPMTHPGTLMAASTRLWFSVQSPSARV